MFDYAQTAIDAQALLADFGQSLPLKRIVKSFDPVLSATSAATYRTQDVTAVILPFKGRLGQLSDHLQEALRKGRLRKLLIGAVGLDFAPEIMDVVTADGFTHTIQSVDPLAPASFPVLYTCIVERTNLSDVDQAATPSP